MPFPREDTTPPVTKTNLVSAFGSRTCAFAVVVKRDYIDAHEAPRGHRSQ